jgi:predicted dehydrogenase
MSEIGIGIVGSGFIAGLHSRALAAAATGVEVPAIALRRVASRNGQTARSLAAQFGWASASTDWHQVTRGDDIDLVLICTPDDAHREVAEDAFAHGKHVFCEKPLAANLPDARAMAAAAKRSGVVQFVGFVLRCWPALEYLRRLVDSGGLGKLENVRARYLLDSETLLESAVGGLGSHVLDALIGLAGRVGSVVATSHPTAADRDVDGRAAALLEFENGCTGVLEVDREARGRAMDLVIEADCTEGGATIRWRDRDVVAIHRAGTESEPDLRRGEVIMGPRTSPFPIVAVDGLGFSLGELLVVQAERLVHAAAGEDVSYPSFGEACHVVEVTDSILASAKDRAWKESA